MDHAKTLQQTHGVTCVVSIVQDFEINSNTLAGQAINGDEWKRLDMEHRMFPSPDFHPPSFDLMNDAADYMAGKILFILLDIILCVIRCSIALLYSTMLHYMISNFCE